MKAEVYVFSREEDLALIINTFCDCFGIERINGNNHLRLENDVQIVDIWAFLPNIGDEYDKTMTQNVIRQQKDMVSAHFAEVQDCDEDIKINFIHHIQQSKAFIPVKIESKVDDPEVQKESLQDTVATILDFLKKVDGVLLVNGATVALNANEDVILTDTGMSQLEYYFPFEYVENPEFLKDCTPVQLTRRNENMKFLFDKRIYVAELPVNDDDEQVNIREKEEVVKRTLGTLAVSLYSEALLNPSEQMEVPEAREFVMDVLKDYGITELDQVMTPDELEYFYDDQSDERTRIDFSWHYEHLYALEWALGLDDWTEPLDICNVSKSVRTLRELGIYEDICKAVQMRSKKEILDKADLVYRMDWACVDARIHGMKSPGGMEPGVVQARHKTLNWLINFGDADWDCVDIPT